MKIGLALFARFGLFTPKETAPDPFELRLQRIGRRERGHKLAPAMFRNQRSPLGA